MHLINAVDIPYGPEVWIQGNKGFTQWTIWSTIYDQKNRFFYYRTYDNQNLRRIDFSKLNFDNGSPGKTIPIFGGVNFIDDTHRFLTPAK